MRRLKTFGVASGRPKELLALSAVATVAIGLVLRFTVSHPLPVVVGLGFGIVFLAGMAYGIAVTYYTGR